MTRAPDILLDAAPDVAFEPAAPSMAKPFDNRTLLDRVRLSPVQRRLDNATGKGRIHFMARIDGLRLGYCYIRKNACTSFKRLLLDHAPNAGEPAAVERPIDRLMRVARLGPRDAETCDALVFVYRDPAERLLSLYHNKFVERRGETDIFRLFRERTGLEPADTSFLHFVFGYVSGPAGGLDRHLLPQRRHLWRARYTHAIPIARLRGGMTRILGSELAERYFSAPTNATRALRAARSPGADAVSASELAADLAARGTLPDADSFLTEPVRRRIEQLYAEDYAMIARLDGRR